MDDGRSRWGGRGLSGIPDCVQSNLQDVRRAAQLFADAIEASTVTVKRRDYNESPKSSGYRAIHLLFRSEVKIGSDALSIGCEIQIRTLVQDAWGHLSHEDIYKGSPSRRLMAKTRKLSEVLARADRIAEGIRSEVAPYHRVPERPGWAETHRGGRYQSEQAFASRSFHERERIHAANPFGYPPGTEIPPPNTLERFAGSSCSISFFCP